MTKVISQRTPKKKGTQTRFFSHWTTGETSGPKIITFLLQNKTTQFVIFIILYSPSPHLVSTTTVLPFRQHIGPGPSAHGLDISIRVSFCRRSTVSGHTTRHEKKNQGRGEGREREELLMRGKIIMIVSRTCMSHSAHMNTVYYRKRKKKKDPPLRDKPFTRLFICIVYYVLIRLMLCSLDLKPAYNIVVR